MCKRQDQKWGLKQRVQKNVKLCFRHIEILSEVPPLRNQRSNHCIVLGDVVSVVPLFVLSRLDRVWPWFANERREAERDIRRFARERDWWSDALSEEVHGRFDPSLERERGNGEWWRAAWSSGLRGYTCTFIRVSRSNTGEEMHGQNLQTRKMLRPDPDRFLSKLGCYWARGGNKITSLNWAYTLLGRTRLFYETMKAWTYPFYLYYSGKLT